MPMLEGQIDAVIGVDTHRGRPGAKSDALAAIRAGREALARDHLTTPGQRGYREALRVLHTTRAAIVAAGADARRQLRP